MVQIVNTIPKYMAVSLIAYVFFFLTTLSYFIIPAIGFGLTSHILFNLFLILSILPGIIFAGYYFSEDIAFVRHHKTIFGLLFTLLSWLFNLFTFIVILPIV